MPSYMHDKYYTPLSGIASAKPRNYGVFGHNAVPVNPLYYLSPALTAGFLPTRVAQLAFWGQVYGWTTGTYVWEPPGLADSITRIRTLYPKFPNFELHIWLDFDIANQIQTAGYDANYVSKLTTTESDVSAMCTTNADIGFTYEGRVSTSSLPTTRINTIIANFIANA